MTAAIDLVGRVALVTGAGGGIGRAIVAALAEAGARVIATDLGDHGPPEAAEYLRLDVTDEAAWRALAGRIERLDILVNNAGRVLVKPLAATGLDEWRDLFAVNVQGVFLGTRALLPALRGAASDRSAGASIINMSSVAGIGGGARLAAYCATKGAVRLFTKACALEFAHHRIRVNSVHPGGVDTPMMTAIGDAYAEQGLASDTGAALSGLAAAHPLGRLVTPEEVARAVRFLASDEAAYMTGSEVVVDGGWTAR